MVTKGHCHFTFLTLKWEVGNVNHAFKCWHLSLFLRESVPLRATWFSTFHPCNDRGKCYYRKWQARFIFAAMEDESIVVVCKTCGNQDAWQGISSKFVRWPKWAAWIICKCRHCTWFAFSSHCSVPCIWVVWIVIRMLLECSSWNNCTIHVLGMIP